MNLAIELFGNLILSFLGFVVPIVGALLSIFQEGTSILTDQYEKEREQTEKKLKAQYLKKNKEKDNEIDLDEIQKTIDELKKIEKDAENKLSSLNPKEQIIKLFVPLALSFLGIEVASLVIDKNTQAYQMSYSVVYVLLLFSIAMFVLALAVLWSSLTIIIEMKKASDETRATDELENRQALLTTLKKLEEEEGYFLKKVDIMVDDETVGAKKPKIPIPVQEKRKLDIVICNRETRMAKEVEIGFYFSLDFIIDKEGPKSIYKRESNQIVRYRAKSVYGKEKLHVGPLAITPLKKGPFEVDTFIKAENIEPMPDSFVLDIT